MKTGAIILAAGRGKRMQSDVPKQYIELEGRPILYYTLQAFEKSPVDELVIVCGKEEQEFCKREIVEKYHFQKVKAIVAGGKERYHSVYEGLKACSDIAYVMIHDGARPFISQELIRTLLETVQQGINCIPGVPVTDTIKRVSNGMIVETPDRQTLYAAQTPQTFAYDIIFQAYQKLIEDEENGIKPAQSITDDAMVAQLMMNCPVQIVPGSYNNIKVTNPSDLAQAAALLSHK